MRFSYGDGLLKNRILLTTFLAVIIITSLSLYENIVITIISLIVGVVSLALVIFFGYIENRMKKMEFVIEEKGIVIIYQNTDLYIYWQEIVYIKETDFGVVLGLDGGYEEFAILNKIADYKKFLQLLFEKAEENDIMVMYQV